LAVYVLEILLISASDIEVGSSSNAALSAADITPALVVVATRISTLSVDSDFPSNDFYVTLIVTLSSDASESKLVTAD